MQGREVHPLQVSPTFITAPPFSEGLMTMAVCSHDFYGTQKVCSGKGGEAGQEKNSPGQHGNLL